MGITDIMGVGCLDFGVSYVGFAFGIEVLRLNYKEVSLNYALCLKLLLFINVHDYPAVEIL